MKKYVLILCTALVFILNCKHVDAIFDYNGGTTSGGSIGSGDWNSYYVGLKVSILSSKNELKETKIIVNYKGINGKVSSQVKPKTKQDKEITWIDSNDLDKHDVITNKSLPKQWLDDDININIYNYLTASKYSLLLNILNSFKTKGPGDYILVEPMVYIGSYYGTAFELGNDFMNSTYDNSFSRSYKRVLFSGSDKNPASKKGGLFYTTIYLTSNVPAVGLTKFSSNGYNQRNNCLLSKTCGRGIGVFKYDDIYTGKLKIVKKESGTNNVISGAGFTLYSDASCSKKIKNEQKTNSNGEIVFNNLSTGNYYYKETTVPSGYKANTTCAMVKVTNEKTTSKSVTNSKTPTQGNLNIYIYNDVTKTLITNPESQATYEIFESANCSGTKVNHVITSSGVASISNLSPGTYSIKEVSVPSGYIPKKDKCVKTNVQIVANSTTNESIFYQLGCDEKLKQSDGSVRSLLNLYQEYGWNGLLNFSNPVCGKIDCPNKERPLTTVGCLSASGTNSSFNENNMACFDNELQDLTGKYIGFCSNTLTLSNNLGENSFYNKAGQFLIKKTDENIIQFYKNKDNLIKINNAYVATANVSKVCYALSGNIPTNEEIERLDLHLYFGKNNPEDTDINELPSEKNTTAQQVNTSNGFVKYSYIDHYNFNLNKVYLERLTGRVVDKKNGVLEQIGILIPFNAPTSGNIPFELKYGKKTYSSDACKYNSEQEVIKTPPGEDVPSGKLDIEFRIINLENPFLNENGDIRSTNSNWCDYSAPKGEQCNANNNVVLENIINAPNSYGRNSNGPIYKIKLTSSDIKKIRQYNKVTAYDNYEIYCDAKGCKNAFLYGLENATLKKYVDNNEQKSYGAISKLYVNKPLPNSNTDNIGNKLINKFNINLAEVLDKIKK